jgi:hypothetical protein
MQFLLNFTEFACGAPLPFGNLLKRLKQLLVLLQKVIGLPFKALFTRNSRIACKADQFSNIPLGERNLEYNKIDVSLKFCLPSAIFILMKVYPAIPLSGRSNLVRRYLKQEQILTFLQ